VTAAYSTGGESPPSEVVFWSCGSDPGYSRLQRPAVPSSPDYYVAQTGVSSSEEDLVCRAEERVMGEAPLGLGATLAAPAPSQEVTAFASPAVAAGPESGALCRSLRSGRSRTRRGASCTFTRIISDLCGW